MNRFISIIAVFASLIISGCGNLPLSTIAGAAAGNIITGNSQGTAVGAAAGLIGGAVANATNPNNGRQSVSGGQACWQLTNGRQACCNQGDTLVTRNGVPTCKRGGNQVVGGINHVDGIGDAEMVCGPAQWTMSCASLQVPGRQCRYCPKRN